MTQRASGSPLARSKAKVLITVKTYPTPSQHHIETVCVAGVRLDTPRPEWLRLYPIPYRALDFNSVQFKKYQVIKVPIAHRGTRDPRPESFSPDNSQIELGDVVTTGRKNWAERKALLGHLVGETTACELFRINQATPMNQPAPSLGLIKPRDILDVKVKPGQPWTTRQQEKVDRAAEPTLFEEAAILNKLEPPPLTLHVRYRCMTSDCRGHNQTILDWEVGAAAYNWRRNYPSHEIPQRVLEHWQKMMEPSKDTHFYLGNQHQHRASFSILGVWYPKA